MFVDIDTKLTTAKKVAVVKKMAISCLKMEVDTLTP